MKIHTSLPTPALLLNYKNHYSGSIHTTLPVSNYLNQWRKLKDGVPEEEEDGYTEAASEVSPTK
jgi:hypothetical protein